MILEEEGVYGYCELDELDLDLVTLDTDILSLEMPEFFRSFYLVCKTISFPKFFCQAVSSQSLCFKLFLPHLSCCEHFSFVGLSDRSHLM